MVQNTEKGSVPENRIWQRKKPENGQKWEFRSWALSTGGTSVGFHHDSLDSLNRLTNVVDAAGTTVYGYTAGNQLWTEDGPFSSDTVTNSYSNRVRTSLSLQHSNRVRTSLSLQQPTGLWTNKFVYDLARRMTNVTSPAGAFGYTVGAASSGSVLVKKLLLPNTSYITNTFDSVARLRGTYLDNSSSSVLDSAVYGYNTANQRTTFTNAAGTYVQYSYDNIGQLKVATSSTSTENRGYAYDTAWNLNYLTNNGSLDTFTVDSKNQLTGDPNAPSDSYDANGNIQNREWSGLLLYAYTYDDENRLASIEYDDYGASPPLWLTDFVYDGLGRLRKRIEYSYNSGGTPVWSNECHYVYDGSRVIQERDTNNTPTVSYTRGTDLSGSLEGAGGIGGLLARSSGYSGGNWSTHYFYHADGNGNITYLVDGSQAMAAIYRYDPFGSTISSSGSQAAANVYRFSSKEIHVNSGMYVYLYRFYDPSLQRWLNRDTYGERGSINLYRFCRNASIARIDPFGLQDPGEGTGWGGTGTEPEGEGPMDHDTGGGSEEDTPYTFTTEYGWGRYGAGAGILCGRLINWATSPSPQSPPPPPLAPPGGGCSTCPNNPPVFVPLPSHPSGPPSPPRILGVPPGSGCSTCDVNSPRLN